MAYGVTSVQLQLRKFPVSAELQAQLEHAEKLLAAARADLESLAGSMGPSGSGKSPLLYWLSGMKEPREGAVRFLGQGLHTMSPSRRAWTAN